MLRETIADYPLADIHNPTRVAVKPDDVNPNCANLVEIDSIE